MSKNTGRSPENKNLRLPWASGLSGNPKGRPLGAKDGIRAHLKRALNKAACPEALVILKEKGLKLSDKTNGAAIAAILIEMAIKGDIQAIKLLMEQTEISLKTEVDVNMKGKMDQTVKRLNIHFVGVDGGGIIRGSSPNERVL